MYLNIYLSNNFSNRLEFERFFIDNFLFKNREDYLAGEFIDIYFYDIDSFKLDSSFDVIILDEYMINQISKDENIANSILKKLSKYNYQFITFIALTPNFNKLPLSKANIIKAYDIKEDLFEFLFTEITHDILRSLLGKERLNIFISHAKSDATELAKSIKYFIDSDLKLSNFFDEIDIQNSDNWSEKLKESIKRSLFLYILSDNYAQTLWTKKELIYARENLKAVVGIDVLSKDTILSPYISNTKLFKLLQHIQTIEVDCQDKYLFHTKSNIRAIINFLLREALEYELSKAKGVNIPRKPDFFDLCNIKGDIIYPDPPMMSIELEQLKRCFRDRKVTTPINIDDKIVSKKIAISISQSPDINQKGLRLEHLQILMIEVARYLIFSGATLIYGGDLGYKSSFNFTQILAELFRAYNRLGNQKRLLNYSVEPFSKNIDIKIENDYMDVIEFKKIKSNECNFDDRKAISQNLTIMREEITKDMDIKVAVGGKISGFSGFYPGVLEEVYLALDSNKPVILIYGCGGIVDKIVEFIRGDNPKELTFEYQLVANINMNRILADDAKEYERVKEHYSKMLSTIKEKRDKIEILEFEGFDNLISKFIGIL